MSSPATAESIHVNHWPDERCAKSFWTQHELPPYQKLLADTGEWIEPRTGERWLDLGCGGGQLTRIIWEKSGGTVGEVVALDCAPANAKEIAKLRGRVRPAAPADRLRFVQADFSTGLADCPDASFDGAVSGLAIQYAQSFSTELGRWTADAYDHLLSEVCRVLRPGGTFVFSVNVPEPAWVKIALYGLPALFTSRKPLRFAKNAVRMLRYGSWLKREARLGRFHYLPAAVIADKLNAAGFVAIQTRLSFARQAYLIRCHKPVEVEWLTR
jgi:ubiquinone/menaquinone biosynthesis C-methylase UbiE